MTEILLNTLSQTLIIFLSIAIVGLLIYCVNKIFFKVIKHRGSYIVTGIIGTPLHELSHAVMCIIFGHKITNIKLFQMPDEDGVMGYVENNYNPKNIYQLMGNFFIGVAPIICGASIIYLLIMLLLPNAYDEINQYLNDYVLIRTKDNSISFFAYEMKVLFELFKIVLFEIKTGFLWFIFVIIALCISQHMQLSPADILGALKGLPFFAIIILLLNVIFGIFPSNIYDSYLTIMIKIESVLVFLLLISLLFIVILLILTILIKLGIISVKQIRKLIVKS